MASCSLTVPFPTPIPHFGCAPAHEYHSTFPKLIFNIFLPHTNIPMVRSHRLPHLCISDLLPDPIYRYISLLMILPTQFFPPQ